MTEETLRKAIVEAIGEEVARRVSAKLIALQKKALVVCTASTMGFSQWIVGLQQLEQEGKAFVFRPAPEVVIGRLSKNQKTLQQLYQAGYADACEKVQAIADFAPWEK